MGRRAITTQMLILYRLRTQASILTLPSESIFPDSRLLVLPVWFCDRKCGFSEFHSGFAETELISQETASAASWGWSD